MCPYGRYVLEVFSITFRKPIKASGQYFKGCARAAPAGRCKYGACAACTCARQFFSQVVDVRLLVGKAINMRIFPIVLIWIPLEDEVSSDFSSSRLIIVMYIWIIIEFFHSVNCISSNWSLKWQIESVNC